MLQTFGKDIFMNAWGFCLLLMFLMLAFIRDPQTPVPPTIPPPGNLAVMIAWEPGPIDVDLWLTGPGQDIATGYSHKGGKLISLLRDDLGTTNDTGPINVENAFGRETPAGEYAINVHCFSCSGATVVYVEVALGRSAAGMSLLFKGSVELKPKQERTVVRFRLDQDGNVIPGSVHHVYRPLREAGK
ncbi:MAG: hypothetical protein E5Y67_12275 [Mesorhizobium sp.]|uniref:hypothetical protein n=1 Tax=Mesorhizobium sp. TaxID=1871066 RepID=UPI0012157E57|nr:hypothetical protein [Mesorhizobium sp.]TIM14449.1 MAG: hypothetical protein E5Y67_12275 [Mesorhizobium sp.]